MSFSFLKSLNASVRNYTSSIKTQAKRLHAASESVFGNSYSVEVCNEAVARANGFRNWKEVSNLAKETGQDRLTPFWFLEHRTPEHAGYLDAFIKTDLEMSESVPVVILGSIEHSTTVATALWTEQISNRQEPGVIVIETDAPTYQKTPVWDSAKYLGLKPIFEKFRVVDARSKYLSFLINLNPWQWADAITSSLKQKDRFELQQARIGRNICRLLQMVNAERQFHNDDYCTASALERVAIYLGSPRQISITLDTFDSSKYEWYYALDSHYRKFDGLDDLEMQDYMTPILEKVIRILFDLSNKLPEQSEHGNGVVLNHSAKFLPTVVLCNSENSTSMVIAAAVRKLYAEESREERERDTKDINFKARPLFYCSTLKNEEIPEFLFPYEFVFANGKKDINDPLFENWMTRRAVFVEALEDGLIASGNHVSTISFDPEW